MFQANNENIFYSDTITVLLSSLYIDDSYIHLNALFSLNMLSTNNINLYIMDISSVPPALTN